MSVINEHEQAGRPEKIGECARTFDPLSEHPLPPSQYQPWLRSDSIALRDGIAANFAMKVLAEKGWARDNGRNPIVAFYDVGGEPGLAPGAESIGAGGLGVVTAEDGMGAPGTDVATGGSTGLQ